MTLYDRIRSYFRQPFPPAPPTLPTNATNALPLTPLPQLMTHPRPAAVEESVENASAEPSMLKPYWLSDPDTLRDEGVLFGLSDAQPDEKVAEITAFFRHQAVSVARNKEQSEEALRETNRQISQWETQAHALQARIDAVINPRPASDTLLRNVVSLLVSVVLCIGGFYLVDATLQPVFSNHWIALGVFLAGMFNLSGRTSFFYEEGTRLTGRRLVEELGLPVAAALFILVQALHRQPLGQAVALFLFVLFLFLLAGKLLLSLLIRLQHDLLALGLERQQKHDQQRILPDLESQLRLLNNDLASYRSQQGLQASALRRQEAALVGLNAQRDQLVNLFLSEFELARSLRYRLSEQQRQDVLHG
ncbi:hypothetical protein [Spirosoma rigui]|uniref:hypothetical protein n=1 Tax=Spirosoma rigui TaxID=564064 RepID=UPI0012D3591E|nr:hypothetical protein [Spirosoma rigui]